MVSTRSAHGTPIALKSVILLQDYMPNGSVAPYGTSLHSGSKHCVCTEKGQHGGEQGWDMALVNKCR